MMTDSDPSRPNLISLKRALLVVCVVLVLISSDKIGNEINFLGLKIGQDGHPVFVGLTLLALGYYALEYFWIAWQVFQLRQTPEVVQQQTLVDRISKTIEVIHRIDGDLRQETYGDHMEGAVPNPKVIVERNFENQRVEFLSELVKCKTLLEQSGLSLRKPFDSEHRRFLLFDLLAPFLLVAFAFLHGCGEFFEWWPTCLD